MARRYGIYGSFHMEEAAESQLLEVGLGRGCAQNGAEIFMEYEFTPPVSEETLSEIINDETTPARVLNLFQSPVDREDVEPNSVFRVDGEPSQQHLSLAICAMERLLDHTDITLGVVRARLGLSSKVQSHVVAELSDHI